MMKSSTYLSDNEQFLKNKKGELEYVVIPVEKYKKLLDLIEDYGLGLAMKEAEGEKTYNRKETLEILDRD